MSDTIAISKSEFEEFLRQNQQLIERYEQLLEQVKELLASNKDLEAKLGAAEARLKSFDRSVQSKVEEGDKLLREARARLVSLLSRTEGVLLTK